MKSSPSVFLLGLGLTLGTMSGCGDDSEDATDATTTADGDNTTGDGDGDNTTTGDGDGDSTTTGDGDGDGTTTAGDGDGDGTTTAGDGDGDETTTAGDGDGDGTTTAGDGDGDGTTGDGDGDACSGLSESDCNANADCVAHMGRPLLPVGSSGTDLCYEEAEFAYCMMGECLGGPCSEANPNVGGTCLPTDGSGFDNVVCEGTNTWDLWWFCPSYPTGWNECQPGAIVGACP